MIGIQLPIQAQSSMFVADWERDAGPDDLARIARTCDEAGYDYVGVCDHVGIPRDRAEAMGTHWADPIGTLGFLAGQTERIALLSHVYVLPYRHPLMAAKQFANLDHLSGGRVIAGIGAGHVDGEFTALGVDFAGRGQALDAALPRFAEALEHEFVAVDGGELGLRPRPTQTPRPPIWIGGSSAPALRRAARFGDGWLPQGLATDELIASLRRHLADEGRADAPFVVGHIVAPMYVGTPDFDAGPFTFSGSGEEIAAKLLAMTPDGVDQIQVRVVARSAEECCDQLAAAAEAVLPHLRTP